MIAVLTPGQQPDDEDAYPADIDYVSAICLFHVANLLLDTRSERLVGSEGPVWLRIGRAEASVLASTCKVISKLRRGRVNDNYEDGYNASHSKQRHPIDKRTTTNRKIKNRIIDATMEL